MERQPVPSDEPKPDHDGDPAPPATVLSALLLGQATVWIGEDRSRPIAWSTRAARRLGLLFLATPEKRLSRERALDLLWPDLPPPAARNALAKALHGVRLALSPVAANGRAIEADRATIAIAPGLSLRVDADEFETALAGLPVEPAGRRTALRAALALYRGDLLATEIDADWVAGRREALRHAWRRAALDLIELDLAARTPVPAIELAERLLAADETDEAAHRTLMRALLAAGERDRALAQFERCALVLRRELDTDPDEKTLALRPAILAGTLPPPAVRRPTRRHRPPAPRAPLVGRERGLEATERLLLRPEVRLVTVIGPGGVGKTRLALEIARRLADDLEGGACFVELAAITDERLVVAAIGAGARRGGARRSIARRDAGGGDRRDRTAAGARQRRAGDRGRRRGWSAVAGLPEPDDSGDQPRTAPPAG